MPGGCARGRGTASYPRMAASRQRALTRHQLDRVARAVVSGRRGLGPRMNRLADFIARGMRPRLAAAGLDDRIPPARHVPAKAPCDRLTRDLLYSRAGKHLASAVATGAHEAARPR